MRTNMLLNIRSFIFVLVGIFITEILSHHGLRCLRVKEKLYEELQSDHYCARRLNSTHQFGCTSEPGGNVGTLWMISKEQDDLEHILKHGQSPPYIAVMSELSFTNENLLKFKNAHPQRLSGVIVLRMNETIPKFSPDTIRPNQYFGLYVNSTNSQAWQLPSPGNDMLFQDFPFPIFLITQLSSIESIQKCAVHNRGAGSSSTSTLEASWPLCGAQLDSFMTAAKNSIACLTERSSVDSLLTTSISRCRYMSLPNIFSYYKPEIENQPANKTETPLVPDRSIVMITTRMDSMSMFKDLTPGADSPTTSIVTLLAIADALVKSRNKDLVQIKERNIAFALFSAESLDYSSSSKTVVDLIDKVYPRYPYTSSNSPGTESPHNTKKVQKLKNMQLKSIDYLIELTQLAAYTNNDGQKIYIHTDLDNVRKAQKKISTAKVAFPESSNFQWANESLPLPPASSQIFLKHDLEIAALVVANHEREFSNLYYNSIFDNAQNIFKLGITQQAQHLSSVATILARAAFELAFGAVDETIMANATFVEELLTCYLINANCTFFNAASPANAIGQLPTSGLNTFDDPIQRKMTQMSLAYILGEKLQLLNLTQCRDEAIKNPGYAYDYINGEGKRDLCIRSQTLETTSISPAWYHYKDENVLRQYPAWTISETNIRHPVRIFYQSSRTQDWSTFALGLIVTVASFALLHFGFNKWISKLAADIRI